MKICRRRLPVLGVLALGLLALPAFGFDRLDVTVTPRRPEPGDTVVVRITAPADGSEVKAALLIPKSGRTPLDLKAPAADAKDRTYEASIALGAGDPEGLYAIHVWTGSEKTPKAVGKGWFLRGRLIVDYPILSLVDPKRPEADIRAYLEDIHGLGLNFLVVHVLIDAKKAYYPSEVARNNVLRGSPSDYVETFLRLSDRIGFACLLSVSWDMTHNTDYATAPAEIRWITDELWALYGHHPSLAGFYSYQEGSGTYLVPYLREFCGHVKKHHPNLLTACAPYVDDPLLSGYLSMLDSLDMVIFQGMTMASFRPDNVKRYPLRRVRDLCGVGIGGKWLQDKIAITHTELFGYLESRAAKGHNTTTYENILPQVLSAATAAGSDGVSFFTYHANIYNAGRKPANAKDIARAREAVVDGLKAYNIIWEKVARRPNPVAFYYPYEDWVIERWWTGYLPAIDAFRRLGVAADFVPFAPAITESVYPFYPYRPNGTALRRYLDEKMALVLPDVSGFHNVDSEFVKAFLEQGGTIVAFGPQLPMGNTYDRDALLGAAEGTKVPRREIVVRKPAGSRVKGGPDSGWGRLSPGRAGRRDRPRSWPNSRTERPRCSRTASGRASSRRSRWTRRRRPGRSRTSSATSSTRRWPSRAVSGPSTSWATTENIDLASCFIAGGVRAAVVNHAAEPVDVVIVPLGTGASAAGIWTDLATGTTRPGRAADGALAISVPALGYICWEYKR